MKNIPLSQGQFSNVDDDDFEKLSQYKWYAAYSKTSKSYYAARTTTINGKRKNILMHREILGVTNPNILVDHIDHNTLDNRKQNIRLATNSLIQGNSRKQSNNTSGLKGISFLKRTGKWYSQIMINGKKNHLGYFGNAIDAAKAYNDAARKYFGEFALLNEI